MTRLLGVASTVALDHIGDRLRHSRATVRTGSHDGFDVGQFPLDAELPRIKTVDKLLSRNLKKFLRLLLWGA